jgi:hypothetical protein
MDKEAQTERMLRDRQSVRHYAWPSDPAPAVAAAGLELDVDRDFAQPRQANDLGRAGTAIA